MTGQPDTAKIWTEFESGVCSPQQDRDTIRALCDALDATRADNAILQQMHYNQVRFVAESDVRAEAAEERIVRALDALDAPVRSAMRVALARAALTEASDLKAQIISLHARGMR